MIMGIIIQSALTSNCSPLAGTQIADMLYQDLERFEEDKYQASLLRKNF